MQEWTDGVKLAVDVLVACIIVVALIVCTQLSRTIMLTNPNDWMLISTSVDDLDDYMARKAYMSWEVDEVTGLYTMEVSLAE